MNVFRLLLLPALCLALSQAHALELKPGTDGLDIDAGTLGKFTLEYPLLPAGGKKEKPVEKSPAGKAVTVKYANGATIKTTISGDKIHCDLSDFPADIKNLEIHMKIPIAFNQGGKWKIGGKEGEFPVAKPEKAHMYQGSTSVAEITNYEGRTLTLKMPDNSFYQLSDNREWGWAIFNLMTLVQIDANKKILRHHCYRDRSRRWHQGWPPCGSVRPVHPQRLARESKEPR